MNSLKIAWTTVSNERIAEDIAEQIITQNLAACVQIEGPIKSFYKWKDKLHYEDEYRLWIKFIINKENNLLDFIKKNHPYETPQWIVVNADEVESAYLKWAEGEK